MSILTDLVEVNLFYTIKENRFKVKKIVILKDEDAEKMLQDPEKKDLVQTLKTKWCYLGWRDQNRAINEATRGNNPVTGERELDWGAYRDFIIKNCLREWNLMDKGMIIPVAPDVIDQIPSPIIEELYKKFDAMSNYSEDEMGK